MKVSAKFVLLGVGAAVLALSACSKKEETPAQPEAKAQKFDTYCEINRKDGKLTTQGDCSPADMAKVPAGDDDFHYKSSVNEGAQKRGQ